MPRDWEHITLKIGAAGESPSADDVGRRPPLNEVVENFVFDRDGGLGPRPAILETATNFWTMDDPGVPVTGTQTATSAFLPNAVARVRSGQGEVPLLLQQGRGYVLDNAGTIWHDLGSFWSLRQARLGAGDLPLDYGGSEILGVGAALSGGSHYLSWGNPLFGGETHGTDGQRLASDLFHFSLSNSPSLAPLTAQGAARLDTAAATVYNTSGGRLILKWYTAADPHTNNESQLASDARTTGGQFQAAIWDTITQRLFVAYLTTTATQMKLLAVNTSGTVTNTVTYTHGNNLGAVFLNKVNGKLVVAMAESAATLDVQTKIYSCATPPVDQALDVLIAAASANQPGFLTVGPGSGVNAVVAWTCNNTAEWCTRSTTAATATARRTLAGNASAPVRFWRPCWAPWRQGGRTLMGLTTGSGDFAGSSATWFVADVTDPTHDTGPLSLAALGPPFGSASIYPVVVDPLNDGNALVTSADFVEFDSGVGGTRVVSNVSRLEATVVPGTTQPPQIPVAEADGAWLLGGSITHHYDGVNLVETGFVGRPAMNVAIAGGGSIAAGTYAMQVVWAWTDAQGKTHRSFPSEVVSPVSGGAGTFTVTAHTCLATKKTSAVVEIYASAANPPASGFYPMYLQRRLANVFGSATVGIALTTLTTSTELLYTDGGVIGNFPPPGSDGGLASVGGRVWAASGRHLAASKLLSNGPPAFNEDLGVVLPASGGDARALIADGDNLVVFCERAIYMVGGAGPDDLLQGQEFSEPVHLSDLGCSGPRAVERCPAGIVFQSSDFRLHLLRGSSTERIATAIEAPFADSNSPLVADARVELVHYPKHDSVAVLQAGRHLPVLWNYRNGQWYHWDSSVMTQAPGSGCLVDGELWLAGDQSSGTSSSVFHTSQDAVDNYRGTPAVILQRLVTSWVPLDSDRSRGWARCGAVNIIGTVADDPASYTGQVLVDRDYVRLTSRETHTFNAASVPGSPATTWPTQRLAPEIRLSAQKCSVVRFEITTERTRLAEIELDVRRAGPAAPPLSRQ